MIKTKSKTKRPNSSKKRKPDAVEQRYSANYGNPGKQGLMANSTGLYNGNYGDRNSCFINQNTLSLNIGGGTFNQATKAKENFLSKTIGSDSFKSSNLTGVKPNTTSDKIGSLKKSGPIKATVSTEKVKKNNYLFSPNNENETYEAQKKLAKQVSREKRPHSSTFIGHNQKEIELYSKIMTAGSKHKAKPSKEPAKEPAKPKKVNKRVRSASPGGLKNYLTQKQAVPKAKPQRVIGGNLYQPIANTFTTSQIKKV